MEAKEEIENALQKLDKMLQAKFGGYSIKRLLIWVIALNVLAMQWAYCSGTNILLISAQDIAFLMVLLGYNNQEKKIDANTELEKLKIEKQPNLETN